jgi:hypothetical protein
MVRPAGAPELLKVTGEEKAPTDVIVVVVVADPP